MKSHARMLQRIVRPLLCLIVVSSGAAQQPTSDNVKLGDVDVTGWFRTRAMVWDWFQGNANNQYAYSESFFRVSFAQSRSALDWKLELAAPVILGLPNDAIAPGTQGQLGFGGTYFAANSKSTSAAMIFAKQGYLRWKLPSGGTFKQAVQVGRTEFRDGAEVTPKNSTLAVLVRDRISERLIGNFGFSDVGRSFDGVEYTATGPKTTIALLGARPTRGVYQVDGWGEVNASVFYGAITRQIGSGENAGEWRAFGIGYQDYRNTILKTDNRPQTARAADRDIINIATIGGDYIGTAKTKAGKVDVLLWGALQRGSWGTLSQRAYSFAAEAGWQAPLLGRIKPWLRGGYNYGSGDKNPADNVHGTFFQMLPTARLYARFPFFDMMNNRDAFGQLILRLPRAVTIRSDVHSLALANKNDLWYSGGGLYQPQTFGYTGRPSNGHSGLATLYDVSSDYLLNSHWSFTAYYAYANGKLVSEALYPKNKNAKFGYLELNYRF